MLVEDHVVLSPYAGYPVGREVLRGDELLVLGIFKLLRPLWDGQKGDFYIRVIR